MSEGTLSLELRYMCKMCQYIGYTGLCTPATSVSYDSLALVPKVIHKHNTKMACWCPHMHNGNTIVLPKSKAFLGTPQKRTTH